MKKALLLFVLMPFVARAQILGNGLGDLMNTSNLSPLEAAAASIIGQLLGIKPQAVVQQVQPYGVSVYETAPAYYIVHETHRPFAEVWQQRKKGKGWGVIAKEMGMHPGTFNKLRNDGAFDHYCWVNMTRRYSVRDTDWNRYNDRDIVIASALGNGDRNRFNNVLHERVNTGYWNVPGHSKVKGSDAWGKVKPTKSNKSKANGKGKSVGNGNGKTKDHGNGNVKTKVHGNGNGKAKGGGSGNGKGKGSGNGNGKGKGKGGG